MRVRTRPRPGRLRLNRASTTSHSAWIVSPAKTGFSTLSSMCRKAKPVCCMVDCTSSPSAKAQTSAAGASRCLMSDSCARNSRLVNNTSTMPVQLTKLVMSASVTVRPIVLNCRPTGRSSKQNPSPTVSILFPPYQCGCCAASPPGEDRAEPQGLALAVGDERQACLTAGVVDYLQYALAVGEILDPKFLDEAAVVDQV